MKRNTPALTSTQHVSCLRHSTYASGFCHRIEIRCYKMIWACGSVSSNAILSNTIDKIFQPFLQQSQPAKETGLGLSLAYGIIIKEHNGIIKAESNDGEGTTFLIKVP